VSYSATATLTDGNNANPTTVSTLNPDALDVGNRCVGSITLAAGQTRTVTWTNSQPGGDARTIGYWKNWSSCTGGNQWTKALARDEWNKTLDGNLPQDVGLLHLNGAPGPNTASPDCQKAVYVLGKSDINTGKTKAGDPAFSMAAQLLGAKLNRNAGVPAACNIDQLITDAQALLVQVHYNGTGTSDIGGKNADATLVAKANLFNSLLDKYNNNQCVNYVPGP